MGLFLCVLGLWAAQVDTGTVTLTGTVADTTGRPIASSEVRLDSLPWSRVSGAGTYEFDRVSLGTHSLQIRALGFEQVSFPMTIAGGPTVAIEVQLRRGTVLPEVVVSAASGTSRASELPPDFLERRATNSGGTFLDRDQIAKRITSHTSELLRSIPGITLFPFTNENGMTEYNLVMRGITTVKGDICPIQFYLDGHPLEPDDNIDRLITPQQIAAVEVYRGSSQTPLQFRGPRARCGVVVIWSAR